MVSGPDPIWWTTRIACRRRGCGACGRRGASSKWRWEPRSGFHGHVRIHSLRDHAAACSQKRCSYSAGLM